MIALESQYPMPRLRRVLRPWLLAVAVPLALGACGDADSALAPTAEPAAEPATAPIEAVAPGDALALTTAQRIAFMSYRYSSDPDLFTMDPLGGHVVHLIGSAQNESSAAWSYDNKRLALVRTRVNGGVSNPDVYLINADGTNGHWVRSTPFPYGMIDPSWSPDGSRILVRVWLQSIGYLGWIDVATGQVNLFNAISGGTRGREPSYSASGQKIVYVGDSEKTIEQINADGSGHKIRFTSATPVGFPTFSPDGKKIAFGRGVGTGNNTEIFVKNLVDGSLKRLTTSAGRDNHPSWSADGSRIAFTSERTGTDQIWTMNATGGDLVRLTHTTTYEETPAWSH